MYFSELVFLYIKEKLFVIARTFSSQKPFDILN